MRKVRIHGLVKLANHVRKEISQPISPERLAQLRENTSRSIETVMGGMHTIRQVDRKSLALGWVFLYGSIGRFRRVIFLSIQRHTSTARGFVFIDEKLWDPLLELV